MRRFGKEGADSTTFREITDALAAEQEEEALVPGHLHKWLYGRIHGREHGKGRREIYATMFAQMEPLDSKTVSDAEFVRMFSGQELTRAARASAKGKAGAVQLSPPPPFVLIGHVASLTPY